MPLPIGPTNTVGTRLAAHIEAPKQPKNEPANKEEDILSYSDRDTTRGNDPAERRYSRDVHHTFGEK